MTPDFTAFIYKAAASAVVGAIIAALLWPFRKARKEWSTLKEEQASIHAELVQQRTNCLTTLQTQGVQHIELLGKTVAALDGVRLDLAEQTGYLKAAMVQPIRRRRTAKK
jgi:hypothetical protein